MLEAMPARTFRQWQLYAQEHPFSRDRSDLMIAILCALFANAHAAKGKRYKPEDFMPRYGPPERPSPEALRRKFEMFVKAHNAAERARR